jgi:hypothetical protein
MHQLTVQWCAIWVHVACEKYDPNLLQWSSVRHPGSHMEVMTAWEWNVCWHRHFETGSQQQLFGPSCGERLPVLSVQTAQMNHTLTPTDWMLVAAGSQGARSQQLLTRWLVIPFVLSCFRVRCSAVSLTTQRGGGDDDRNKISTDASSASQREEKDFWLISPDTLVDSVFLFSSKTQECHKLSFFTANRNTHCHYLENIFGCTHSFCPSITGIHLRSETCKCLILSPEIFPSLAHEGNKPGRGNLIRSSTGTGDESVRRTSWWWL